MIKKHWPVVFAVLVVIVSAILGIYASNSTDAGVAIVVGVIIFLLLLPLAGAVIGAWYGWRIRSPRKWLLAPAVFLGVILLLAAGDLLSGSEPMEADTYLYTGSITGIVCLAAEAVLSAIARLAGRSRAKRMQSDTRD